MLTTERPAPNDRPTSLGQNGSAAAVRRPAPPPSIDWLGIIVRHKSLLALAITLASVLGFILYTRQQPIYGSALKLMIWTHVPPSIVNGETIVQPVSVGKHQNLLVSEVVLTKAVADGNLGELETFRGQAAPVSSLRQMLSVVPVEGAADTLNLTIRGPNPNELPQILNEVVAAYQHIISEDAAAIGQSSVDLIQKLQQHVTDEKSTSEKRYFELIQKLGVAPDPESGQFINPHASQSAQLHSLLTETQREHRGVDERIKGIRALQEVPADQRADMLKAVAIEASKYLLINPREEDLLNKPGGEFDDRREMLNRISLRIANLEATVIEAEARLDRMQRSSGINHPTVVTLSNELAIASSQLSTLVSQRNRIQSELTTEIQAGSENKTVQPAAGLALNQFDHDLIMIYLASLDREKDRLQLSMDAISGDIAEQEKLATSMAVEIDELNVLSREIDRKDTVIREILDRLSEMTVLAGNHTSTKIRVIDSPGIGYLVEPKLLNFMLLSVFLGGVLGLGGGWLLDWTELSFHNPEEIQEKLATPVIARIPTLKTSSREKAGADKSKPTLVTLLRPQSAEAESYRSCRAAMLFTAKQQGNKTFLITSPSAGDGKTTTATNLATSLAQGGYKTVLVDADLRRPRCHHYLTETGSPGIKELAAGQATIEQVVRPTTVHSNLSFVGTSKALSNPSEFLESKAFDELIQSLQKKFDFVIIDSPPTLPVADAMTLSSRSDAVLLVLRVRKGVVLAAQKAMDNLRSVEANVIGVIVNSVDKSSHYSDYGRYGYRGYGGYNYYANRYYGKQNAKYYREEKEEKEEAQK